MTPEAKRWQTKWVKKGKHVTHFAMEATERLLEALYAAGLDITWTQFKPSMDNGVYLECQHNNKLLETYVTRFGEYLISTCYISDNDDPQLTPMSSLAEVDSAVAWLLS